MTALHWGTGTENLPCAERAGAEHPPRPGLCADPDLCPRVNKNIVGSSCVLSTCKPLAYTLRVKQEQLELQDSALKASVVVRILGSLSSDCSAWVSQ